MRDPQWRVFVFYKFKKINKKFTDEMLERPKFLLFQFNYTDILKFNTNNRISSKFVLIKYVRLNTYTEIVASKFRFFTPCSLRVLFLTCAQSFLIISVYKSSDPNLILWFTCKCSNSVFLRTRVYDLWPKYTTCFHLILTLKQT